MLYCDYLNDRITTMLKGDIVFVFPRCLKTEVNNNNGDVQRTQTNINPAVSHMRSQNILKESDEITINSKESEREKITEFVKLLKKRGKSGYPVFKEYLKSSEGSEHLVEELDKTLDIVRGKMSTDVKDKTNVLLVSSSQIKFMLHPVT